MSSVVYSASTKLGSMYRMMVYLRGVMGRICGCRGWRKDLDQGAGVSYDDLLAILVMRPDLKEYPALIAFRLNIGHSSLIGQGIFVLYWSNELAAQGAPSDPAPGVG